MSRYVTLNPPDYLLPYWDFINEGWKAYAAELPMQSNPYPPSMQAKAWEWGWKEGQDYGG